MNQTEQVVKPKVYIPYTVSNIIEGLWQDHITLERSIIGKVVKYDDKFIITDVFIPRQTNKQAHTEMEDPLEDIQNYLIDTNKFDGASQWRLWLHSHNTMQPFWSGTDNSTRKSLCTDVFWEEDKGYGWSLSIVIGNNKKYYATVDYAYLDGDKKIMSSEDVEVVVGLIDDSYTPSEDEINEFMSTLVFTDNEDIHNVFPTDIANKIYHKSQRSIEDYKNNKINGFINSKRMELALIKEQEIIDNGVLGQIPTLEEYIAELKAKETVVTYHNNKNNKSLFTNVTQYGFQYSHQKHKYVLGDLQFTYEEAVQYIQEQESKKDQDILWYDIDTKDIQAFGYTQNPKTLLREKDGEKLSYRSAQEKVADLYNDHKVSKELPTLESLSIAECEDYGYERDTMTKNWKLKTAEGIYSIFDNANEMKQDCYNRFIKDDNEVEEENYNDIMEEELYMAGYTYNKKKKKRKFGRQYFKSLEEAYNHLQETDSGMESNRLIDKGYEVFNGEWYYTEHGYEWLGNYSEALEHFKNNQ